MLQLFTQADLNSLQSSHFLTALTDRRNSISPAGVGSEQSGHVEARILWALTDFYLKETKTGAARRTGMPGCQAARLCKAGKA